MSLFVPDHDLGIERAPMGAEAFVHPPIGEEIRAVGGSYHYLREVIWGFEGRPLLYLVGSSQLDTSCCGVGGCGYALVVGFVERLQVRDSDDGQLVSLVEPIRSLDDAAGQRLIKQIKEAEQVQDVQLWSPTRGTRQESSS